MPTVRPRAAVSRLVAESLETRRHFALSAADYPDSFNGSGFDTVSKIIATPDGGHVTAGLFSGQLKLRGFAPVGPANVPLGPAARGDTDIFVAKYDSTGAIEWVETLGGDATNRELERYSRRNIPINPSRLADHVGKVGELPKGAAEYVNDLAVDAAGNIYLAGAFRESIAVGSFTLTADQSFDRDFYDALVVKFSAAGAVTWARQIGGAFDDNALSIALDGAGTPIIGGYYSRSADFDPTSGVYRLESPEGRNAGFVMRMTDAGGLAWAYQFGSDAIATSERNAVNDIAVTPRGDVYFAGTFGSTADFDPSRGSYELESEGRNDGVFGRLSRRGQFQWALRVGGEEEDGFNNIAMDPTGSVYTAGYFSDEVDVDPRRNVTNVFQPAVEEEGDDPDYTDVLVSKWAADGRPLWQAQLGGEFYETVSDLQIGPDGSVYTVGAFTGNQADFAPGRSQVLRRSTPVTDGESIRDQNARARREESYDWYVSRLSPRNGSFIGVGTFGSGDDDYASGLAVNAAGQVIVGGRAVVARSGSDRDDRDEYGLTLVLNDLLRSI